MTSNLETWDHASAQYNLTLVVFKTSTTPYMFLLSLCLRFGANFFSETWLTKHKSPPNFGDYKCRSFVREGKRERAVSNCVREGATHCLIDDCFVINPNMEGLAFCIEKTFADFVYRPPIGNKLHLYTFIESLLQCIGLPVFLLLSSVT